MANYFEELNSVDFTGKVEKKNGLSYVAWAYAWGELKKKHPDATYKIYKNEQGWNYHTDGRTCWVETGVTANNIEHIEHLAIMDFKNKSIPLDNVTSMDVTKSIQRSLTKACARHGLGLYVYAGEDLPEEIGGESNVTPVNKPSEASLGTQIENCKTEEELSALYNKNKSAITSNDSLLQKMVARGKELKQVA
jgi:hypothetical protein